MANISYTELVPEGIESDPYRIKQMPYHVKKPFKSKMNFLGKCTVKLDGIGKYF